MNDQANLTAGPISGWSIACRACGAHYQLLEVDRPSRCRDCDAGGVSAFRVVTVTLAASTAGGYYLPGVPLGVQARVAEVAREAAAREAIQ